MTSSSNRSLLFIALVTTCLLSAGCLSRTQSRYVWEANVDGKERKAVIWSSSNWLEKPSAVVYFHGRAGTASSSEAALDIHHLWPEAVVVYAEGTHFNGDSGGTLGWEIRFPHMFDSCGRSGDVEYVKALLKHLVENENVAQDRIYAAGHSSGGFFTLSLSQILHDKFRAFASVGSYASFSPVYTDCTNPYVDGILLSTARKQSVAPLPARILYILGTKEDDIRPNAQVYNPDCAKFSYGQNTIVQLGKKNKSSLPSCNESNFMSNLERQVFPALDTSGAETQVQLYQGNHKLPNGANGWIVSYFKGQE